MLWRAPYYASGVTGAWEHRVCANISVNEYDLLSNSCNKIMFFYSSCCPKVPLALKIDDLNRSVSSSYDNIHKAITELSTKIDNLNSSESQLQKSIAKTSTAALSTVQSSAPNSADTTPSSPVSAHIVDALDEYMDRERRKHNLVIYGMPESSDSASAELGTNDHARFSNLVRSQFNIENINISKVIRIGRSTNGRPRPLLVTLLDNHLEDIYCRMQNLFETILHTIMCIYPQT